MEQIIGSIINIKRFEIHDGDGLRTTLFLKGCPLRCKWCHNPESLSTKSELGYYEHKCINCGSCANICPYEAHTFKDGIHKFNRDKCRTCGKCASICLAEALILYGEKVTPSEILPKLLADKDFYRSSGGGVTISGGEPLLQVDFTAELLRLLKSKDINTAVDTCLFAPKENLKKVAQFTDTFLVDVKAFDRDVHKALTGQYNDIIIENIRYLDSISKPMEIRIPYIPKLNSEEIPQIAEFLSAIKSITGVRVLAYHNLSGTKYDSLDMQYTLSNDTTPPPQKEEVESVRKTIESYGIKVIR